MAGVGIKAMQNHNFFRYPSNANGQVPLMFPVIPNGYHDVVSSQDVTECHHA